MDAEDMCPTDPYRDAPGGYRAVLNGCTCPVVDNHNGAGYEDQGVFILTVGCPFHHIPEPAKLAVATE